jgi:hypothetical protein
LPQIDEAPISKFPEFFKQVLKEEKQLFDNTQAKTFKVPLLKEARSLTEISHFSLELAVKELYPQLILSHGLEK